MRHLIITLLILFAFVNMASSNTRYKLDEVVWQDNSSGWLNSNRDTYRYNYDGKKTEQVYYEWKSASWVPIEKWIYEYNTQQLLSKSVFQKFSNNIWQDSTQTFHNYDQNGFLTELINQSKGFSSTEWQNEVKENYVVDGAGNTTASTAYEWNSEQSKWQGVARDFATFNADGNLTASSSDTWDDLLEVWVPFDRETYTYPANSDITRSTYERWDEFDEKWTNSFKDYTEIYEENGTPKLRYLSHVWNDSKNDWEYYSKEFHTLQADDRLLDYTEYYYNTFLSRWDYYDKEEYTYSTNNDLTVYIDYNRDEPYNRWIQSSKENISYTTSISGDDLILPFEGADLDIYFNSRMDQVILSDWNSGRGRWDEIQKGIFSYSIFDPVGAKKVIDLHAKVCPNPAKDNIQVQLPADFKGTLKLVDISGEILVNQEIESFTILPIAAYSKGIYILLVRSASGSSYQQKIVFE